MSRLEITDDDSKVLGSSLYRYGNRSAGHFTTKKFMTHNSAWTPVNHKPSNEQVNVIKNLLCKNLQTPPID